MSLRELEVTGATSDPDLTAISCEFLKQKIVLKTDFCLYVQKMYILNMEQMSITKMEM